MILRGTPSRSMFLTVEVMDFSASWRPIGIDVDRDALVASRSWSPA